MPLKEKQYVDDPLCSASEMNIEDSESDVLSIKKEIF